MPPTDPYIDALVDAITNWVQITDWRNDRKLIGRVPHLGLKTRVNTYLSFSAYYHIAPIVRNGKVEGYDAKMYSSKHGDLYFNTRLGVLIIHPDDDDRELIYLTDEEVLQCEEELEIFLIERTRGPYMCSPDGKEYWKWTVDWQEPEPEPEPEPVVMDEWQRYWAEWEEKVEYELLRERDEEWELLTDPRTLEGEEWLDYWYGDYDPWDEICELAKEFGIRRKKK